MEPWVRRVSSVDLDIENAAEEADLPKEDKSTPPMPESL
jgi:hypothetical protein